VSKQHLGIRVSSSTSASPTPGVEELSGGYYYKKDPTWTPNDPRYREAVKPPLTSGSAPSASLREGRITRFGEALADLGYPDPRTAPLAAVLEAGLRVDVGEATARKYRAALLKRQEAAS
jgi:hypothetical protein